MEQDLPVRQVGLEVVTALEDNIHLPVPMLLQFELALARNPSDRATRAVYRDWLLEHGCQKRADQLAREPEPTEPPVYTGPVRPRGNYDWSRL